MTTASLNEAQNRRRLFKVQASLPLGSRDRGDLVFEMLVAGRDAILRLWQTPKDGSLGFEGKVLSFSACNFFLFFY